MPDYISSAIKNTKYGNVEAVPQSAPISEDQVKNSAGGYVYEASDFTRLNRFLIIGTEGGSFYASQRDLTTENIDSVMRAIKANPLAVAQRVLEVSVNGLAHRQDPTLFVWSLLLNHGNEESKDFVALHTPEVARTGTMMMQLANYIQTTKGWSRRKNRAVASWYTSKNAGQLAYQIAKYPSRMGWDHNGVIRQTHPRGADEEQVAVIRHLMGDYDEYVLEEKIGPNTLTGKRRAIDAKNAADLVIAIDQYKLTWEMIPTEHLNDPIVWDALVPRMNYAALVRNLNRLTINGWLAPASSNRNMVMKKLTDTQSIVESMIHPFAIYLGARTYGSGRGMRGNNTWTPVTGITDALDEAFAKAFVNVEPTNLRHLLALDVSGSMTSPVMPGVSAMEASAALALITLRIEPNVQVVAFSSEKTGNYNRWNEKGDIDLLQPIDLSGKTTITAVEKTLNRLRFAGTNCALPFMWADKHGYEFDSFSVYTDSETWAGDIHPSVALRKYRENYVSDARSLVVGMTSNGFTIADPKDAGMLDCVGLSADLPKVAADFFTGVI